MHNSSNSLTVEISRRTWSCTSRCSRKEEDVGGACETVCRRTCITGSTACIARETIAGSDVERSSGCTSATSEVGVEVGSSGTGEAVVDEGPVAGVAVRVARRAVDPVHVELRGSCTG